MQPSLNRLLEEKDKIVSKIYGDPGSSPSNTLRVHHHKRTASDISANSDQERDEDDNGYGTVSRKGSRRYVSTAISGLKAGPLVDRESHRMVEIWIFS